MADPSERWEDNVTGPWFVDRSCILCSLCSEIAPHSFKESDDGDHDVVYHQPTTEEEVEEAVRRKIASQKRDIPVGSSEWEVLFRKYYEEEIGKIRRVRE